MAKLKLLFIKIIQDSQEYGSDNQHMVSRVFFDIELKGVITRGLYADVKQPVGADFERDPLEVSFPRGYRGPIDYAKFRAEVEEYYRESIGSRGTGIRIGGGANIRMMNNTFIRPKIVEFDINEGGEPSGW